MESEGDVNGQSELPALWWNTDEQIALRVTGNLILYDYPNDSHASQPEEVELRHECEECGKCFSQQSDLANHKYLHRKEKKNKKFKSSKEAGKQDAEKDRQKKHLDGDTRGKKYKCKVCGEKFLDERLLKSHMPVHDRDKKYECGICGKLFALKKKLQSHIEHTCAAASDRVKEKAETAETINPYAVKIKTEDAEIEDGGGGHVAENEDGESANIFATDAEHVAEVKIEQEEFEHDENEMAGIINYLYGHNETVVKQPPAENVILCVVCGKQFSDTPSLQLHTEEHNTNLLCELCGKFYKRKMVLIKHLEKMHNAEVRWKAQDDDDKSTVLSDDIFIFAAKNIVCLKCGKLFPDNNSFRFHIQEHSQWEEYMERWNREYGKEEESEELREVGEKFKPEHDSKTSPEKKKFKCEVCGSRFTQKGNLITHKKIHIREKSFRCEVCGKGFNQKKALKRHMAGKRHQALSGLTYTNEQITETNTTVTKIGRFEIHTGSDEQSTDEKFSSHTDKDERFTENMTDESKKVEEPCEDIQYQCQECGVLFSQKCDLKIHMFVHTGESKYKCEECYEVFTKKLDLKSHIRRQHTNKSRKSLHVPADKGAKKTSSMLVRNENKEGTQKPGKLKIKHKSKKSQLEVVIGKNQIALTHVKTGKKTKHKKVEVIVKTESKGEADDNKQMPQLNGKSKYKCPVCGRGFTKNGHLKNHMVGHKPPYSCDKCDKVFRQVESLNIHKGQQHSSDDKNTCKECGRRFVYSGSLRSHMATHAGVKSVKCDKCGIIFHRNVELRRHMITEHNEQHSVTKPESPNKCKECGKVYMQKLSLKLHMRLHNGEKNYKCGTCGRAFLRRDYLAAHILSHTQERKFACQKCGKNFLLKSHINRHMHTVHAQ